MIRALRPASPAILLYYGLQAITILVLALMAAHVHDTLSFFIGHWDSAWFLEIARNGYEIPVSATANGAPGHNSLVFFPLYPALVAVPVSIGLPGVWAGFGVSLLAGGVAAWGLFELGREVADPRAGTLLAALWAIAPGASAQHLVYSESLLVALSAWALVAVLRRQWPLAGWLTLLAGLTRAIAAALVIAVLVAAVTAIVRREDGRRPWVAVSLAPLGLAGYLGYVALRTGRIDGWLWLQSAWQMDFDWGRFTWQRLGPGLVGEVPWLTLTALVVLGAVVLLLWSYTMKMPVALSVYGTLVVFVALTSSSYFQSRARFLLPAFTILLPIAVLAAKLPNRALAILLPAGALGFGWYGAYLMTSAAMNP
ncbi:MAG TPA: hypothetical protein VFG87_01950 [Amycolatopsis sp.]|nr:hypothetical protein [Amycolatopsis sp.]